MNDYEEQINEIISILSDYEQDGERCPRLCIQRIFEALGMQDDLR